MKYIKVRFGKDLQHMHTRLQKTIDDMFQQMTPVLVLSEQSWRPQVDMVEVPDAMTVLVNVAGVAKEDLEVEVDRQAIKIKGIRKQPAHTPGMKYHLAEIDYGRFERVLRLPRAINPEEVQASYANGVLTITMAKRVPPRRRQIPVENK
ncbi:MAG: Hsp20/alpha crystallin family protein [Deltaproteobacteria bacterium]|nr:Hsp20/alpha crystallin family protein [Deltaproteobacteria bacterium]